MSFLQSVPRPSHFFLLLITCSFAFLDASAQVTEETCESVLVEAEEQFINGFFDEAIALLEPCTATDSASQEQLAKTFKLLADVYLAKKYVSEARDAIANLLDLSPNFTPDSNLDSPTFMELLAEIRAERTVPQPPGDFTAVLENNEIILAWAPIEDEDVERLVVFRGGATDDLAPLDSLSAGTSGYTDSDVAPGQTFFYALQAIHSSGLPSELTAVQSVEIPTQDPEPTVEDVADTPPITLSEEPKQKKPGWQKWALIGGGTAGGIIAVVALISKPDDPPVVTTTPLPGPPAIP